MSDGVIQLRHAFLRWPLCVSVVVTLCAILIVGRLISSALHQSLEFRSIELARSIDGGALITRNLGYLQNLVSGLSAYGTTATVLVVQGEPSVIVAASNPKLIGTSLESLLDDTLRDAVATALKTGSFSSCNRLKSPVTHSFWGFPTFPEAAISAIFGRVLGSDAFVQLLGLSRVCFPDASPGPRTGPTTLRDF